MSNESFPPEIPSAPNESARIDEAVRLQEGRRLFRKLTRRQFVMGGGSFVLGGAAVLASTLINQGTVDPSPDEKGPAELLADIRQASTLHADLTAQTASSFGTGTSFASHVQSSGGLVRPASRNLLSDILPLTGGNVEKNVLPQGLEWHSSAAPKTLVSTSANGIVYKGKTTASFPHYFGGIRTKNDMVQPGQSVLVSFRADMAAIVGDANASICVSLLRVGDQKTTFEARAYNYQEDPLSTVTVLLTAPPGGSGGYRIVFTAKAGKSAGGQEVTVNLSKIVVINLPEVSQIGARYSVPPYFLSTLSAKDVVVSPGGAAGAYYVIAKTLEFGWGSAVAVLDDSTDTISLQEIFGPSAHLTVLEIYVIEVTKWQRGWLDVIAPITSWTPLRYLNVSNSAALSFPESPNRLSRATGLPGSISSTLSATHRNVPKLEAPAETWAASFNPDRLSHSRFRVSTQQYIGDAGVGTGVRSEIAASGPIDFEQDFWASFSIRINTTLTDNKYDRYAVLFQCRYTKNDTGDTSKLSPDLALEQLPGNLLRISYRSDNGVPDLLGTAFSSMINTAQVSNLSYVPGQWHNVVVRARFSRDGGGYLGFWFDGNEIINGNVPMGYNRDRGPQFRFGAYKFSESKTDVEFQNIESGKRDLTSRITVPLPV